MRLSLIMLLVVVPSTAEAKVMEFRKVLDCGTLTSIECSQKVLAGLESPGLKLHADTPTDTVQGSVSISFADPPSPSIIRVECYDQDDDPTDVVLPNGKTKHLKDPGTLGPHHSTVRKPAVMPSEQETKAKLDAVVLP